MDNEPAKYKIDKELFEKFRKIILFVVGDNFFIGDSAFNIPCWY